MDIVLIHGSFHGAWCWEPVRPHLEQRGHRVIPVDLPVSVPGMGGAEYAQTVLEAIEDSVEPAVVAHSMGGLVAPLVAAHREIRSLVFLAAFLPKVGTSAQAQRGLEPIDPQVLPRTAQWTDHGNNVWGIGPDTATELFYSDLPVETAQWAVGHLRPQCYDVIHEVTPLAAWPDVKSSVIVCEDDRAINPDWVRSAARDRLGVDAVGIPGSHSPFLSRPAELAALIDRLA
jgi:pimeloyl-ACP methyl ester carboxylesterase